VNRRAFLGAALGASAMLPGIALAQEHPDYSGEKMPDTGDIDPKSDPRVRAVTADLACNCGTCPHEPVSTCTCGTAARLRAEVASFISKGMDGSQARAAMIEKHGYEIVAKPPFSGLNLLAWIGPFVGIAAVGGVLWFKLGDWTKAAATSAEKTDKKNEPSDAAKDPYLARIEAEMEQKGKGRS